MYKDSNGTVKQYGDYQDTFITMRTKPDVEMILDE